MAGRMLSCDDASIVMVGMRQVTASVGVAEQGYVEGMHATHGRSSAGRHGHACNDGKGTA